MHYINESSQEPWNGGPVIDYVFKKGYSASKCLVQQNGSVTHKGRRAKEVVEKGIKSVRLLTVTVSPERNSCINAVKTMTEKAQENFHHK